MHVHLFSQYRWSVAVSVHIEPGNDSMAANVDDATDPVSKAVALNILSL